MTAEASQSGAPSLSASHRSILRLALGASLSFVTAELLGWELSFLIPMFLVQLLTVPGPAPGLRQGTAIVLALGLATGLAATVSSLLVDMPALLAIVLGLVLFLAFVLQRSGRNAGLGTLILVAFGLLPVVAVQAPELVPDLAFYLVRSAAVAVAWVWLLQALLPEAEAEIALPRGPGGGVRGNVVRTALTDVAVLLPVLLVSITLEVPAALVIVLTVTAVLTQHNLAGGRRVALGLLVGNLLGGTTAVAAYQLLAAVPTASLLASLLLLVSLAYASLITGAGQRAPLFVTAFLTFLVVFGMGIAPYLDEPGATLALRLRNIAIACGYAFAALSLIGRAGR